MRSITLALGIIVLGVLAALPFRRTPSKLDAIGSSDYSSGTLGQQMRNAIGDELVQWPDRPGFDPSLAWQPQPMTLDASPRKIEMPPMPAEFPAIDIADLSPVRVQNRFETAPSLDDATLTTDLLKPTNEQIKDRFSYSPPAELPKAERQPSIQPASVISNQNVDRPAPAERQYIREPK